MADLYTLDDYKTFKGIDHFKDDSKINKQQDNNLVSNL